jgi:O-glycosyl hydrolase
MASESFKFNHALTDQILNDTTAAGFVSIIAGHIYGAGLVDYPLARTKGKEVWMTEHYTESSNSGDAWPLALDVGTEIHKNMAANFSAYIWWYIRRSYGPILENGKVSKRGHIMAQYARFVRPGFTRIGASTPSASGLNVTAYKNGSQVAVVVVNTSSSSQTTTLNVRNGCVESFAKYTTSGTKNVAKETSVTLSANSASVTVDAQSVTTFVSE